MAPSSPSQSSCRRCAKRVSPDDGFADLERISHRVQPTVSFYPFQLQLSRCDRLLPVIAARLLMLRG